MLEGDLDGVIGNWRDVLLGNVGKGRDEVGLDEAADTYDDN